jgi:hypothetical protein
MHHYSSCSIKKKFDLVSQNKSYRKCQVLNFLKRFNVSYIIVLFSFIDEELPLQSVRIKKRENEYKKMTFLL